MSWFDLLKKDIEEEILDEVESEGGALGMKNLKDIASKKKIKETVSNMKERGKLFEHKHGDLYTHEPDIEKLSAKQKKIAELAEPKDKIDEKDLKELREKKDD